MDIRGQVGETRTPRVAVLVMVAVTLTLFICASTACASTAAVRWTQRSAAASGAAGAASPELMTIAVMTPMIRATNHRGNVGRDWDTIQRVVTAKILESARQQDPSARLIDAPDESHAMVRALQRGATHLIVPIIQEWTQTRTDDPIGALVSPHNRITIVLRSLRIQQPPLLECEVEFTNRARLTLNQHPARLLDRRFHATVLQLLSCRR